MTFIKLDLAAAELGAAAGAIAGKYGLSASALFYVFRHVEGQIQDLRHQETIAPPEPPAVQDAESKPEESPKPEEAPKTRKIRMSDVKDLIQEKVAAGDVDENGKAHVSIKELAERGQRDDTDD